MNQAQMNEKLAQICTGEMKTCTVILGGKHYGKPWAFGDLEKTLLDAATAPFFYCTIDHAEFLPTDEERAVTMETSARVFVMRFFDICLHSKVFGPVDTRSTLNHGEAIEYAVNYVLNHYTQEVEK